MVSELPYPWRRNRAIGLESQILCKIPNPLPALAAARPYFSSGYGGGPDRRAVKVPDFVPGKIPKPASISGMVTKSMVRYEAVASDSTAIRRIVSATSYKADAGRGEPYLRPAEEPRSLPVLIQPREMKLEMARRNEDLRQINSISTQGVQLMSTPEGNFDFPSMGPSVVVTGWGEDPLPHAFTASPTLNNLNPSYGPEMAKDMEKGYGPEMAKDMEKGYGPEMAKDMEKGVSVVAKKHAFIEEVVLNTLNKQVRHFTGSGNTHMVYPLKPVIEEIQKPAEESGGRRVAKKCLGMEAMRSQPEYNYVAYRKGIGVVCNKKGGFGEDDLVVQFFGEVYLSWRGYEKQDGQYQIGIYTLRPIVEGEKITSDYNSVTESKEEHEAVVCHRGSQICHGSYLNFSGEGAFEKVLMEFHGVLHRHGLLLQVCEANSVFQPDLIDLGRADKRLRCTGLFWKTPPWPDFGAMNGDQFAQRCEYEVIERIYSVKQYNHRVLDYTDKFEELVKLWPFVNEAASELIKTSIESVLEQCRLVVIASLKFSKLTLGTVAPQFTGILIMENSESGIVMGLEMNGDANPSIIIDIKTRLGVSLPIQVNDIGFTGVFHLICRPQVSELPCFEAVCSSLRQKKKLDFKLWVISGEISVIPGTSDALEDTIKNAIEDLITWPVRKVIPIIPGDYSDFELKFVGTVKIYDDDGIQGSKLIGCVQVVLNDLQKGKVKDVWLKLVQDLVIQRDGKNWGQVHLELLYCPFDMKDEAMNNYGKDFGQTSSWVKIRSYEQRKVFFSKARKSLGLDLIHQGTVDIGLPTRNTKRGRSDTDEACTAEMDSTICSTHSCSKMERDVCPLADGAIQGHALSVFTFKQPEVDGLNGLDVVEVKVGECEIRADKNCNITVDHKRLSETTHQASCAPIDINCPESTRDPQNPDDVNQMDMHGNGAMASSTEQAVAVHLEIRSSLHFVEVIPSSKASEGIGTEVLVSIFVLELESFSLKIDLKDLLETSGRADRSL